MITEAIWEEKKYVKGSSSADIRHFILSKYDVDESRIKANLSKTISKMCEDGEDGFPCLKKVDGNFKLSQEWRKSWTKQFNKKTIRKKRKRGPLIILNILVMLIYTFLQKSVKNDKKNTPTKVL